MRTFMIVTLALVLLLAPVAWAFADWDVKYCATGGGMSCFPVSATSYLFAMGNGATQVYYQTNGSGWQYQGVYGVTTTPLPADMPTINLTAAYNQAIVSLLPVTWTVTWYGTPDEVAAALAAMTDTGRIQAKLVTSTSTTTTGKNSTTTTRYGLIHP